MSLPEPGYNGSSGLCSSPPCSKENHKTSSRLLLSPKKSESSSSSLITSSGQKTCTGDVDSWIEQLMRCEKLEENEVFQLCLMAKNIIEQEPNLVNIQSPVTVCGDVHGQFQDLLKLFSTGGFVPDTNYLFLGDYVDRGRCSVETISLLVALKVRHRNRITLLRGNHESRSVSNVYGFYDECVEKYKSFKVWIYFTDLFDLFPLAALVDNIFFCLHGGLSKKLPTLDEIRQLDRLKEVPKKGPMTDLLWADPMPDHENGWRKNIVRGCSCMFGENVSSEFNQLNNLELIARAHQVVVDGYKWHHDYNVLTLFSAPNYCYSLANKAAIMEFYSNQTYWIRQFNKSPISDTVSTTQYTSFYDR